MKREEAIANLNHLYGMVAPDIQRSLDVAIKALERPSGDCISREALKDEVRKHAEYYADRTEEDRYNVGYTECACEVLDFIDNAPTVEIYTKDDMAGAYNEGYICGNKEAGKARPKGKWIITREEQGPCGIIYKTRKCNQCYWENSLLIPRNFCPECGADMREEKRGEEK